MKFELDERELKKYLDWWDNHGCSKEYAGAIGGAVTFRITPTSIGDFVVAICAFCSEECDMSFCEEW